MVGPPSCMKMQGDGFFILKEVKRHGQQYAFYFHCFRYLYYCWGCLYSFCSYARNKITLEEKLIGLGQFYYSLSEQDTKYIWI